MLERILPPCLSIATAGLAVVASHDPFAWMTVASAVALGIVGAIPVFHKASAGAIAACVALVLGLGTMPAPTQPIAGLLIACGAVLALDLATRPVSSSSVEGALRTAALVAVLGAAPLVVMPRLLDFAFPAHALAAGGLALLLAGGVAIARRFPVRGAS